MLNPAELSFTNYIAPRNDEEMKKGLSPPDYTQTGTAYLDFSYASSTTGTTDQKFPLARLTSDQRYFLETVMRHTSLDEGQAHAFVESMTRQVALVQGPPGTGKTYLGTALAKAILSDKNSARHPILAICTTNHALDNFLDDLRKSNITKLVRIGSGSKEDWLKQYSLSNARKTAAKREKSFTAAQRRLAFVRRDGNISLASCPGNVTKFRLTVTAASSLRGLELCQDANLPGHIGWSSISILLRRRYPAIYRQFNIAPPLHNNLKIAGTKYTRKSFPYAFWSTGGDLNPPEDLFDPAFFGFLQPDDLGSMQDLGFSIEPLKNICKDVAHQIHDRQNQDDYDIWALPHTERLKLIEKWSSEIDNKACANIIVNHHFNHLRLEEDINNSFNETDSQILEKAQVIGLTTSACPRMLPLFKELKIKVVICEEAGEVMEAHSLCTFFPSLEHAIFIGDPFQLR